MKRFSYIIAGMAAAALAGCTNDVQLPDSGHYDVTVSFLVDLPSEIGTRAVNDGTKATDLTIAVFDAENNFIYQEEREGVFASGKTQTVNVDLISGHTYTVAFWVDAPTNSPYTITNGVLEVNYDSALCNDDNRDAFYAAKEVTVAPNAVTQSISLTRPFAQVNLGTCDYEQATVNLGKTVTKSEVTIKGCAYKTMNLLNGQVSGDVVDVTFTSNKLPDYETSPAELTAGYKWIGMNYLLCAEGGGTISEISFNVDDASIPTRSYTAGVPVKRNFRSNLLGKLLTEASGWTVSIDSGFSDIMTADGAVVTIADNGTINCISPALPDGVTIAEIEGKAGVSVGANGIQKIFDNTVAGVREALLAGGDVYFTPNTEIAWNSHLSVPQEGLIVHGNGATINTGECDFSVGQYVTFTDGSTVNVEIHNLNNARVWGSNNGNYTVNVKMKNCSFIGEGAGNARYGLGLVMLRSSDFAPATINMTIEDCYVEGVQVGIHTTHKGSLTMKDCKFKNVGIPVNIAKKLNGANFLVNIKDCVFDGCGLDPNGSDSAKDYAAPLRVVDNGGPNNTTTLNIDGCVFTNTLSQWDILTIDYRDGKTWFPVNTTVTNSGTPTMRTTL